jgi:hypothetical protein
LNPARPRRPAQAPPRERLGSTSLQFFFVQHKICVNLANSKWLALSGQINLIG